MGVKQDAQELVQSRREELVRNCATGEIKTYDVHRSGGSLASTISPSARNILDIDIDTELRQFVNVDAGAIILIPDDE